MSQTDRWFELAIVGLLWVMNTVQLISLKGRVSALLTSMSRCPILSPEFRAAAATDEEVLKQLADHVRSCFTLVNHVRKGGARKDGDEASDGLR
jgi:hypothetical protein